MESQKLKVKITATDKIGREESLVLVLDSKTAKRLIQASSNIDRCSTPVRNIELEIALLYDCFRYYPERSNLSRAQYYRLKNFLRLVHHKYYNYNLTITAL